MVEAQSQVLEAIKKDLIKLKKCREIVREDEEGTYEDNYQGLTLA